MDAYHVAPATDEDADAADLYVPGEGERVEYCTDRQDEACAACRRGDCVQVVVSDPDWDAYLVVHGQRRAVEQ